MDLEAVADAKQRLEAAEPKHNLLVIDDEAEIVKALNRQFRRFYNVYTAESAQAGYEIMTSVPIQAIISDQRMPGMSGSEFFSKVKHDYPDAIRLLLTGYADVQAVIAAINDGNIFRYITKPWDPLELETIVREAFERHDLMMNNRRLVLELKTANESLEERVTQRTAELSEANKQLRLLSAQKDKFMGMVVHDLRGPLGNLQMCARLIKEPDVESEEKEVFLDVIDNTTKKMLTLINDLLDINAIESGRLVLEPDTVDISAFVQHVCQLNVQLGARKNIALATEIDPGVGSARFDPKRVEQVLDNLIGNAFKFSHPGTTVTLRVRRESETLLLSVADQGQGIKPEDLPKLFGAFQKTSTQPTGDEASSGLGLSICKRIVDLHGGQIVVDSIYGTGTTFTVHLPA
ncbi:MAG: hybrid sensor histidine kinase/response regulator [Anaerolineae bacterium]